MSRVSPNLANNILQLKPEGTLDTFWRLVINTTFGIAGLLDVATEMGIYEREEDFGQTLGHYGLGNGPYLVVPILGPSNLRDLTGNVVDSVAFNAIDPLDLDDHSEDRKIVFNLLNAIDRRHNIGFRYYDSGSPFEYELVRALYTKKRELDIARQVPYLSPYDCRLLAHGRRSRLLCRNRIRQGFADNAITLYGKVHVNRVINQFLLL
jgi:phospholipid-binding lipoprotein MlaA